MSHFNIQAMSDFSINFRTKIGKNGIDFCHDNSFVKMIKMRLFESFSNTVRKYEGGWWLKAALHTMAKPIFCLKIPNLM